MTKKQKVEFVKMLEDMDHDVNEDQIKEMMKKSVSPFYVYRKLEERWRMPLFKRNEEVHSTFFSVPNVALNSYEKYLARKQRKADKEAELEAMDSQFKAEGFNVRDEGRHFFVKPIILGSPRKAT
jgi:hypothetical protein